MDASNDPIVWIENLKRRANDPVTVTGPAGEVTLTYRQVVEMRDALRLAYNYVANLPADGDDYRAYLLNVLLESEVLARLLMLEEDVPVWQDEHYDDEE